MRDHFRQTVLAFMKYIQMVFETEHRCAGEHVGPYHTSDDPAWFLLRGKTTQYGVITSRIEPFPGLVVKRDRVTPLDVNFWPLCDLSVEMRGIEQGHIAFNGLSVDIFEHSKINDGAR